MHKSDCAALFLCVDLCACFIELLSSFELCSRYVSFIAPLINSNPYSFYQNYLSYRKMNDFQRLSLDAIGTSMEPPVSDNDLNTFRYEINGVLCI